MSDVRCAQALLGRHGVAGCRALAELVEQTHAQRRFRGGPAVPVLDELVADLRLAVALAAAGELAASGQLRDCDGDPGASWVSSRVMATVTGTSPRSVRRWAERGEVGARRVAGRWLFPPGAVDEVRRRSA